MVKKIWKKYSLLLNNVLALVAVILFTDCYFYEEPMAPNSFFAPEITHNQKYSKFFLSFPLLYDTTYSKQNNISDFNTVNVDEWYSFFNGQVTEGNLEYLLYNARLGEIDTAIFSLKKKGFPVSGLMKENVILKVKDTLTALDFLYYLGYAKRCEKYSVYNPGWFDEGDTGDPKYDKSGMAKMEAGGLKQISNSNSSFVKQRYVFQLLRLYYRDAKYDTLINFYAQQKQLIEAVENTMKYRATGYLAAAYYKKKSYAQANYLYGVIYASCPQMQMTAYLSFHPQEQKDWEQAMAMANNPKEKSALWFLLGAYNNPYDALQGIYALDPKSEYIDVLLARSVNLQEELFLDPGSEYGEDDDTMDKATLKTSAVDKDFITFLKTVADKKNVAKPYEWDLAAGYLAWVKGDNDFNKYLSNAESECNHDSLVKEQVRLIRLLDLVRNGKAGDVTFENKVADEMGWLQSKNHPDYFRGNFANDFIIATLRHKYEAAGDEMKATCFKHELPAKAIDDDAYLNRIVAYLGKKNPTPFEELAMYEFHYREDDILQMLALKPFYKCDFKKALAILDRDTAPGAPEAFGDPFVIHINDCHDCDNEDKNKVTYNQSDFMERMLRLKDSIKKAPQNASQIYFLLANGYYNMTYYGNAHDYYNTGLTAISFYELGDDPKTPEIDNMQCDTARAYYIKAMNASNDPEFKAKCCFMAAKCQQNNYYNDGGGAGYFEGGDYYTMLTLKYANTKYYQEIINECGYFKTYLAGKH